MVDNKIRHYHFEPNLNILCSVMYHSYRIRFVGSKPYHRIPTETFHEFIEYLAWEKLGGDSWFKTQINPPHILVKCATKYNLKKKEGSLIDARKETDGNFSAIPSGPDLFWLLFCYDIFVLAHKNVLPVELIERLKSHKEFQGARYELAVAAIVLRAGFDIAWINKDKEKSKSCEFMATHKKTGLKIAVEAKSRRRPGVIHEPTGTDSDQSLSKLVKDAQKKKNNENVPLIIFIDSNHPFISGMLEEKLIFRDAKRTIGSLSKDIDSFNLLVITNFPFHYGDTNKIASPTESAIISPYNNKSIDQNLSDDLEKSINRYSIIPEEI